MKLSIIPQGLNFSLAMDGKPMQTPGKKPFIVPSHPLAEAIVSEWHGHAKFVAGKMPLTSLAYTAIDRIEPQKDAIVEALLVYLDTDTLSYRDDGQSPLLISPAEGLGSGCWHGRQRNSGNVKWNITEGIMPIEQPKGVA